MEARRQESDQRGKLTRMRRHENWSHLPRQGHRVTKP